MPLKYNNDFFGGKTYDYTPTQYQSYGAYNPYSSMLGDTARNNLQQMMSGQLSSSSQQLLDQQFSKNLASTREGAYGMPLGAQKGLETQQAGQNALSAAQLGEQQRQWAITQALPYEQMGANQKYLGYKTGSDENRYRQQWAQNEQDKADQYSQMGGGGFWNDLLGAGSAILGGALGQIGGRLGGGVSDAIFGPLGMSQESSSPYSFMQGGDWDGMNNFLGKPVSQYGYTVQE